ncbi:NADPH2:quinone reductase [Caulobacter ginsengisoli]|uniref:NADPH2:quinone reductase n=1 Tax=Caulobacter ginsengisoli TaxID=400775 RepID=A0ABU0IWB0_9CAUL|nr:quinone oxidoreductase [Caulobacter ginsengisoli]MDQ0465299.1 NADPH2:quinone reductase [Caulobacter ginsengisoli]
MLAIQAVRTGGPEVLEAVDLPVPTPGPGQILVRNAAIGLNYIDTYFRSGLYPAKLPAVLGLEGAGVVEAVGEGVTRFKVGDRAAYGNGPMGAYAEAHLVSADRAVKIPKGVDTETAAAAMLKGMTAEFLLRRCYPVKAGDTILVHAAAGGVGQILVQWAVSLGARVIGTAGSADKAAVAKGLGCEEVILYRDEDVAARVKALTGGAGVRVVYDGVGAATFEGSLSSLGRRGMLVSYGNASGPAPAVLPLRLSQGGSLFLTRPTLFDYVATTPELDSSAKALFAVIASGAVKIQIGQRFALKDARAAHEALEGRETVGATLLIP